LNAAQLLPLPVGNDEIVHRGCGSGNTIGQPGNRLGRKVAADRGPDRRRHAQHPLGAGSIGVEDLDQACVHQRPAQAPWVRPRFERPFLRELAQQSQRRTPVRERSLQRGEERGKGGILLDEPQHDEHEARVGADAELRRDGGQRQRRPRRRLPRVDLPAQPVARRRPVHALGHAAAELARVLGERREFPEDVLRCVPASLRPRAHVGDDGQRRLVEEQPQVTAGCEGDVLEKPLRHGHSCSK
jgi:hypothetical protein